MYNKVKWHGEKSIEHTKKKQYTKGKASQESNRFH